MRKFHLFSLCVCPSSIVQLCEDLFTKINDNTDNSMSYSVEVSPSACCSCFLFFFLTILNHFF